MTGLRERAEVISWLVILIGALIWLPGLWHDLQVRRAIAAFDVNEWFVVRSVSVGDAVQGDPVSMTVDRSILREFRATYTVEVRTFPGRAVQCVASDTLNYHPENQLPPVVTLEWWANDGECAGAKLPPGDYIVLTDWRIAAPIEGMADPVVHSESNIFTVSPVSPEAAAKAIGRQEQLVQEVRQLRIEVQQLRQNIGEGG